MVNVPRIHCHSAYKHYHMFHNNSGSSYGNSIFNTTYNFNGGTMCGGGFWGGLLGGFGMGLGAGLMNMFGGLFGGGMGFGFPMGGMFGGGFGFGGFPMLGGWGGFGGGSRADGAGGKEKETKTKTIEKEKIVEKEVNDRDNRILADLEVKIQTLEAKSKAGTLTQAEIDSLRNEVLEESKKSDKYHKDADDDHYKSLLNRFNNLKVKEKIDNNVRPDNNRPMQKNGQKITLYFGERSNDKKTIDKTIKGNLIGTKTEEKDGKKDVTTYIIDTSNIPGQTFGLRYKIKKNADGTYNVKCINIKHQNSNSAYKTLYVNPNGVNYVLENGKLVNKTNDFVVSAQYHNGYTKITYKEGELPDTNYETVELDKEEIYNTKTGNNNIELTEKDKDQEI